VATTKPLRENVVTKIVLLPLLFMLSFGTPSFAQPCLPDVVAHIDNSDDKGTIYRMASGAVYQELPIEIGEHDGVESFTPWIGDKDPIFVCGDHTLLHVLDMANQCRVGIECTKGLCYHLSAVTCLRRCFAAKNQ
jgi:hypothetical protein